jgi:hypothetical protein
MPEAVEVLTIGATDGPETHVFSRIGGAIRTTDNEIIIADGGSGELRWFDSTGQHKLSIGRKGEGPLEFRSMRGLVQARGDTIAVFDPALRRITLVGADGTFSTTLTVQAVPAALHERPDLPLYRLIGVLTGGEWVFAPESFRWTARKPPQIVWDSLPALVYDAAGAYVSAVGTGGGEYYATPEDGVALPFGNEARFAAGGENLHVVHSAALEVLTYGRRGDVLAIARVTRPRQRVSRGDVKRLVDHYTTLVSHDVPRSAIANRVAALPKPRFLPMAGRVFVDRIGRIWLQEYVRPWVVGDASWYVLDEEGRWLFSMRLPASFVPTDIGSDYALGVSRDSQDVQYLRLFELRGTRM